MNIESIGIIGAGAWGTALAHAIAGAGNHTVLWAHEPTVADSINQRHENQLFLPNIPLNPGIRATPVLEEAVDSDVIFLVTPAPWRRTSFHTSQALSPKQLLNILGR